MAAKDIYPFLAVTPTIGLDMMVHHPEDLIIEGTPMHPSENAFKTIEDDLTCKHWNTAAGILPLQGIQISCQPREYSSLEDAD